VTGIKGICVGAIGALAPLLVSLLAIDLDVVFVNLTAPKAMGYGTKLIVMAGLGGLVGFFHRNEVDEFKIFQLGMSWPAMITVGTLGLGQVRGAEDLERLAIEVDSARAVNPTAVEHLDHIEVRLQERPEGFWPEFRVGALARRTDLPESDLVDASVRSVP